jgi:electron transfer flavoprotein alpha subunit
MNLSEYKDVYVFAEQRNGKLQNVALELLGKARELADANNEKVVAMLLGKDIKPLAQTLIEHGADKVMVVDNDLLKDYLKDEEEDLFWSQGAVELIEKIGTQNWLLLQL